LGTTVVEYISGVVDQEQMEQAVEEY